MTVVRAHFDGRNFVPEEPVDLPEGTPVTVSVVESNGNSPLQDLLDLARRKPILGAPSDWSEQHDHYIHGTPKR